MSSERSLLFGVIAMQAELISADQFAKACALWSTRPEDSLPDILREQSWLLAEDQAHVDYLLERRLRQDGVEFPADISLSSINTEAGLLVAASVRDVSERNLAPSTS